MNLIGGLIFFGGLLSILLNRKHVLLLLLCLEFMYLGVMYCIFLGSGMVGGNLNLIVFMFLLVCEAGLGLSILVGNVYYYGNDSMDSMFLLKC
uniref:NADH dehydrogenase subunit 4L n=1 Tax=Alectorobius microlophi TaxID=1232731 RepID=UPI0022383721|nr:NADH dehydrogenase subunit 4L [Alectorobius microlophi]UYB78427.1 NADH dehydrogenase subunit 4L [Alectorobius microlophi]UYB78440.1 NADH dehydrogenase subunit 4L [Alectorobius microlophi]